MWRTQEVRATGYDAVHLATAVLQRARTADPKAGVWEAADVQWWWCKPRASDSADKLFWIDEHGPVAGVMVTSPNEGAWQCDPIFVPRLSEPDLRFIWDRTLQHANELSLKSIEIPVSDDDDAMAKLALQSGFEAAHQDSTAWMEATSQPAVLAPREGYRLVDRTQRIEATHPLQKRASGLTLRFGDCPLYDPELDLAIETYDGRNAGHSIYWFDPITKVGLVEPVRVEDEFQRQGLARAMLTEGISRLVARGALHIKVSYETAEAGELYHSVGFQTESTTTWYRSRQSQQ